MLAYFLNSVTDRHEMNESVLSLVPRFSTWRYPHLLLNAGACSRYRSINSCYAVPAAPGAQQQTFKCISSSHSILDYRRIQLCTVVTQYPSFCQFTTPVGVLNWMQSSLSSTQLFSLSDRIFTPMRAHSSARFEILVFLRIVNFLAVASLCIHYVAAVVHRRLEWNCLCYRAVCFAIEFGFWHRYYTIFFSSAFAIWRNRAYFIVDLLRISR